MNKRHYEHTLPNIRGSLSNTYDRFAPSSKTCGKCGYVYKGLKLSGRS